MDYSLLTMFCDFLKEKGIEKVDSINKTFDLKYIDEKDIKNQLKVISEFHKVFIQNHDYFSNMFPSYIGRPVEDCNIGIKRLSLSIRKLEDKATDEFSINFINDSKKQLKRARRCIDTIYVSSYIKLIRRSMLRQELCLGDCSFKNITDDNGLKIIDVSSFSYNMVEIDAVKFLGRLKRKEIKANWHSLVKDYCKYENLDADSERFILALMSYPYEYMKCLKKYKKYNKMWNLNEFEHRLKKAIKKDGESLI